MITESQQNIDTESDEISLKGLILKIGEWRQYLLSKWLIILITSLIGGTLGFTYAFLKKPIYTATTSFVLEEGDGKGGLGSLGGLASMAGIDIGGAGGLFSGDNIIELYKSRSMVQKALLTKVIVDKNDVLLVDWFIEFNGLKKKWNKLDWDKIVFKDISRPTVLKDSILREIVKDINKNYLSVTKPDRQLSKIEVNVKASNELFAKNFSEQIVNAVNNFYIQTKTQRSSKNIMVLQHKTDSVRAVMNGAIYTATSIVDATPNLNPTKQTQRVAPVQKAQFSAETNKSILGEMVKNLEMTKMSLLKETPLIQIVDEPILPLEKEKIGIAKGVLLGGAVAAFLSVIVLLLNRIVKEILS